MNYAFHIQVLLLWLCCVDAKVLRFVPQAVSWLQCALQCLSVAERKNPRRNMCATGDLANLKLCELSLGRMDALIDCC